MKQAAAHAAIAHVPDGCVVGVGSGSTVNFFITELGRIRHRVDSAVAASEASAKRLKELGIRVVDLNGVNELPVYVDGADEITRHLAMIKGGGGALTREKLVALAAREMIVVADASKAVARLGVAFPLPIEILPFGHQHTLRRLAQWGEPRLRLKDRKPFITDNAGFIVDLRLPNGVAAADAARLEASIKAVPGVVECGLFCNIARRIILGHANGQVEVR